MSILNDYFMMKYDFHENIIPKYSKVKFITIINNACLVENIENNQRLWVMDYEIYPLCSKDKFHYNGHWSYCEYFHNIAIEYNLY